MNHFVFLSFHFGVKNGSPALGMANSLVVRRVSPGRIIVVLFWTKYAVPRQIKPGILKLTTSRGQRNLYFCQPRRKRLLSYRFVGTKNFDCRSYCGLSRRMQGYLLYKKNCIQEKKYTSVNSFNHGLALTASKQLVPDNITIIPWARVGYEVIK